MDNVGNKEVFTRVEVRNERKLLHEVKMRLMRFLGTCDEEKKKKKKKEKQLSLTGRIERKRSRRRKRIRSVSGPGSQCSSTDFAYFDVL